nr:GMC oxidoreductase [Rhizobium halophytocola]
MRVPTHGGSLRGLLRPNRAVAAGLRWLGRRDGPLAQGLFQVAGYFPAGDDEAVADAQLVLSPALFPLSAPGKPPLVPRRHGVSIAVQQGSPFSRGRVTIQASGRLAVDTGALSDPRDRAFMVSAVARVQDILSRPAFRPHIADPGVFKTVDAGEITCAIGTAYHMAGTARMGRDAQAVTDPKLRLRGLSGLRIADASVMPVIPNAALHFPTMMIAQRASDFIIADA